MLLIRLWLHRLALARVERSYGRYQRHVADARRAWAAVAAAAPDVVPPILRP